MRRGQHLRHPLGGAFRFLIHGKLIGPHRLIFVHPGFDVPAREVAAIGAREGARAQAPDRRTLPVAVVDHARERRLFSSRVLERQPDGSLPGGFRNAVARPGPRPSQQNRDAKIKILSRCTRPFRIWPLIRAPPLPRARRPRPPTPGSRNSARQSEKIVILLYRKRNASAIRNPRNRPSQIPSQGGRGSPRGATSRRRCGFLPGAIESAGSWWPSSEVTPGECDQHWRSPLGCHGAERTLGRSALQFRGPSQQTGSCGERLAASR